MLKLLRKKGVAKKVIWFVAIVIIISFGFLGTAYLITGDTSGPGYAGRIYGKKVTIDDFNKVYQNVRLQAIRQHGANLDKVAHLLNLDGQTWDQLILLNEAKKRKIKISNTDVVNAIETDASFQKNNQFDVLIYNSILRNLRVRPRDYEESVRDNLKIAELYKQEISSVTISDEEVFEEYKSINEKIQVSYILVSAELFKDEVTFEEEELKTYYADHEDEFLEAPSVNVAYFSFDFPQLEEKEENADENVDDQEDQEALIEQKQDVIRDQADDIFQQLLVNPNMEEIAAKNKVKLLTSGFFSMEQPNLSLGWSYDLLNRIFQMDMDEVNEPFESDTGITIVQIKEKQDSYVAEYEDSLEKIREALRKVKSKEIAKVKANQYLQSIKEELDKSKIRDFPKAAKELKLEILQSPVFNRGQYLPQIGISKDFQDAAFALNEDNKISDIVEIPNGYCILHLDSYEPVDEAEYEKAKEDLARSISQEKQNEAFGDYVMQLRVESGLVDNISQLRAQAQ